ncbi:MAG TPA: hypothetical protein VFM44_09580 [Gemmatimonadota bacterium]|nr:hypothetical protein [Gemmatimonadota bacterium]
MIDAYAAVLTEIDLTASLYIGPGRADPSGFPSESFVERLLPALHEKGIEAEYCRPGCLTNDQSPTNVHVLLFEAVQEDGGYWIRVIRSGSYGPQPDAGWLIDDRFLVVERDGCWKVARKEQLRIS